MPTPPPAAVLRHPTSLLLALALAVLSLSIVAPSTAAAATAAVDASPAAMLAPYYTDLDLTGDDQVTKADLAVLTDHLGATTASTDWATVSAADTDAGEREARSGVAWVLTRSITFQVFSLEIGAVSSIRTVSPCLNSLLSS